MGAWPAGLASDGVTCRPSEANTHICLIYERIRAFHPAGHVWPPGLEFDTCPTERHVTPPPVALSRVYDAERNSQNSTEVLVVPEPFSSSLCLAAVLWCSGSHIYGVSEGQWGLLPGSARCLCRRVNGQTCHRSDALEPQEGPRKVGGTGTPPRTSDNRPGWGNSTRCTLPSSASAWPESRWNQPFYFSLLLLSLFPEEKVLIVRPKLPRLLFSRFANLEGDRRICVSGFLEACWTFVFDIPSELN